MELIEFKVMINAVPNKVWSVLWSDISYRQWTSAFAEGSSYEGELEEGNIIKFLDANNNGMYSKIVKKKAAEEMTFLHLGEIYDGVEVPQDWGEATESYFLKIKDDLTELTVTVNTSEEFKTFFEEHFPQALQNIKHLSENQL